MGLHVDEPCSSIANTLHKHAKGGVRCEEQCQQQQQQQQQQPLSRTRAAAAARKVARKRPTSLSKASRGRAVGCRVFKARRRSQAEGLAAGARAARVTAPPGNVGPVGASCVYEGPGGV